MALLIAEGGGGQTQPCMVLMVFGRRAADGRGAWTHLHDDVGRVWVVVKHELEVAHRLQLHAAHEVEAPTAALLVPGGGLVDQPLPVCLRFAWARRLAVIHRLPAQGVGQQFYGLSQLKFNPG